MSIIWNNKNTKSCMAIKIKENLNKTSGFINKMSYLYGYF